MSADITGKSWVKATVFRLDRQPIFGNSIETVEGEDWVRHRHVIAPLFRSANLKAMASVMADSAKSMADRWACIINFGLPDIDILEEIISGTGEILARISFGISHEHGREVQGKFRALQATLFKSNLFLGVPYGNFLNPRRTVKAKILGTAIDTLLHSIITERRHGTWKGQMEIKVLDQLLAQENTSEGHRKRGLTYKELVDKCKTFFFSGFEIAALVLSWTLFLPALHPEWQSQLREEIREVIGDGVIIDATGIAGLKKMGWVMNEVLRLYSPAPKVQRQARHDIQGGNLVIPNGTKIWIDVVSMDHDLSLWGKGVNEFKPERFKMIYLEGTATNVGGGLMNAGLMVWLYKAVFFVPFPFVQ